jgi:alcohol dehydrogenase, propanol-preferring
LSGVKIKDVPIPTPGPRDLLVKVTAASLCHSDFSSIFGEETPMPLKKHLIPGHEACGIVVEAGPIASSQYGFAKGDRVGADASANMCLKCADCTEFGPQFCLTKDFLGFSEDGFFAEYAIFDAATAVKIPEEFGGKNMASVAPILCAGITVWDALTRAGAPRLKKGDWVGIVGCGGLGSFLSGIALIVGHMAVQYANALGYRTLAVDIKDKQLEFVKTLGATATLNPKNVNDVHKAAEEITGTRGVHVALTTSGVAAVYKTAFQITRSHGRIVAIGIARDPLPLKPDDIIIDCKEYESCGDV